MARYRISVSIYEESFFWIVIDNGKFIRNPTKDDLKCTKIRSYNKTNICPARREENNITDNSILYPKNTRLIDGIWYSEMHSNRLRSLRKNTRDNIGPNYNHTDLSCKEECKEYKNKISKFNPMSKEFQEYAKRLGLTGNQLTEKYINEGKLPDLKDVDRIYLNNLAMKKGFKDRAEQMRNEDWYIIKHDPISENKDSPHYLGTHIAARKYGKKYYCPYLERLYRK